jgi:hypothetical protein
MMMDDGGLDLDFGFDFDGFGCPTVSLPAKFASTEDGRVYD